MVSLRKRPSTMANFTFPISGIRRRHGEADKELAIGWEVVDEHDVDAVPRALRRDVGRRVVRVEDHHAPHLAPVIAEDRALLRPEGEAERACSLRKVARD